MTVFDVIDGERSIMLPEELRRVVEKQCLSTLLSSKRLFVTLDQVSKERAPENGGYNLTSVSWRGRKPNKDGGVERTAQLEAAVKLGGKQKFGAGKMKWARQEGGWERSHSMEHMVVEQFH